MPADGVLAMVSSEEIIARRVSLDTAIRREAALRGIETSLYEHGNEGLLIVSSLLSPSGLEGGRRR